MKTVITALFAVLLILFASCTPPDVTIVSDPYFEAFTFPDKTEKSAWQEAAENRGKSLEIEVASFDETDDSGRAALRILEKVRSEYVICTPLASFFIAEAMSESGGGEIEEDPAYKHLFLFEVGERQVPQRQVLPLNTTVVMIDRRDAFQETARLMEQYVENTEGVRPAALFYTGIPEREAEMEAFFDGLENSPLLSDLYYKEMDSLDNKRGALDFMQEINTRDVGLLFLAASSLNSICIEQMSKETTLLITEKAGLSTSYSDQLLFSIKTDYKSAIMDIIAQYLDTELEILEMSASVVKGGAAEASKLFE
jgi:hypothetical protein